MGLILKSSGLEFDKSITRIAEALFNLLKNDSPTSTIKRGGYLYQDFTYSQTDNGKPQICSVFLSRSQFTDAEVSTKVAAVHAIRSIIYGKLAQNAKLSYFNKITFIVQ